MGSLAGAGQLSAILLLIVLLVLAFERLARGRARYHAGAQGARPLPRFTLSAPRAAAALAACLVPIALGFAMPAAALLAMTLRRGDARAGALFGELAAHSIMLATISATAAVGIALVLAYSMRMAPSPFTLGATRIAVLGYAVPGAVIAVGTLLAFGWADRLADAWMRAIWGTSLGLLLSGTIVALVLAYLVRFLAAAFNAVEASLAKVTPSLDEVPRSLGHGLAATLWRVHVPLLRGGLLTGAMLVFVDVMKELPATLVVRPFNFDTLAIRVYNLAADERLAEASTAALTIVLVGLLPVIVLSLAMNRQRESPP